LRASSTQGSEIWPVPPTNRMFMKYLRSFFAALAERSR
jgi:hypothetical protein